MKLKVVYFGTPDFSATLLEKLLNDKALPIEIVAVVTQPDMPVGRRKIITPSPVKKLAKKYGIEVLDENLKSKIQISESNLNSKINSELLILKSKLRAADIAIVYAYGKIIPAKMLKLPKHGFINLHPSLLPKYRGPSPIAYPLILGDKTTGVSIIQMDEKMDHGPILAQEKYDILPTDTRQDLEQKLTDIGFELLKKLVNVIASDRRDRGNPVEIASSSRRKLGTPRNDNITEQKHSQTTYTRLLTRDDGYIPLNVLKKALKNEPIIYDELPKIIKEYLNKNPNLKIQISKQYQNSKSKNSNSLNTEYCVLNTNLLIYNLWRGLSPWPGLWTTIKINSIDKRLKLLDLTLSELPITNFQLHINSVQLEGKSPIAYKEFSKYYSL